MDTVPCDCTQGERVGEGSWRTSVLPGKAGPVSLSEIDKQWRSSPYGRHFIDQPARFTNRHPMTKQDALYYLGPDACPQGHQDSFVSYIDLVVKTEDDLGTLFSIDDTDRTLLYFVAKFHDIGELTHQDLAAAGFSPIGDIAFGFKTTEQRQEEARIRQYLFSSPPFDTLDEHFLARAEAIIAHDHATMYALRDSTEHLHEIYETAHNIQSLDTAARAQFAIEHEPGMSQEHPSLYSQLTLLSARVRHDEGERLRQRSAYFGVMPLVETALKKYNHQVTATNIEHHRLCTPRMVIPLGAKCTRLCLHTGTES